MDAGPGDDHVDGGDGNVVIGGAGDDTALVGAPWTDYQEPFEQGGSIDGGDGNGPDCHFGKRRAPRH